MNEKKGQVQGIIICPNCDAKTDLSKYFINPESLTEEIAEGQYRRPKCVCGRGYSYYEVRQAIEKESVQL
jgi:hypothetical protein